MPATTTLDVAVLVFARAPRPGEVKRRLIPRLGPWRAAQLHLRLTHHALRVAAAAGCGPVELHLSARHALFKRSELQRGADLGERMHRALSRALRRHRGALLIGADCPALRPADLRRAARRLAGGCDVVLGPAEDGGYVLIGARRAVPRVFEDIAWGGPKVYAASAQRLDALGYRWSALRLLWDVDRPSDLDRLKALRFASAPRRGARR
ncbi:MAG TPA: TIGR04282 family arsenosugar biosynthesis glycosyltransferase [Burkholderiales bacterium]|nr:TIGR04282 family arsenosugar biosynthesis glycosyltransferase [Burkholderiales bacterium]